jgi:NAD(P)-dependent dehydrogenase (short-subunit alcohol dehydrogenase family)
MTTVIVTGAADGLGPVVAADLARSGLDVLVDDPDARKRLWDVSEQLVS